MRANTFTQSHFPVFTIYTADHCTLLVTLPPPGSYPDDKMVQIQKIRHLPFPIQPSQYPSPIPRDRRDIFNSEPHVPRLDVAINHRLYLKISILSKYRQLVSQNIEHSFNSSVLSSPRQARTFSMGNCQKSCLRCNGKEVKTGTFYKTYNQ